MFIVHRLFAGSLAITFPVGCHVSNLEPSTESVIRTPVRNEYDVRSFGPLFRSLYCCHFVYGGSCSGSWQAPAHGGQSKSPVLEKYIEIM